MAFGRVAHPFEMGRGFDGAAVGVPHALVFKRAGFVLKFRTGALNSVLLVISPETNRL
jgi:hypothetical protein